MDAELRAEIGREMDRIEALIHDLRAENERLREALINIIKPYQADSNRLIHSQQQIAHIAKEALK